ncbi:MAG: V-type ATP synthase subunit D [Candidatus Woesearchaeota archaeon]
MALEIKPTRSELLRLKTRIKLAKNGHSLLKKKRDGLIMEFFDVMKEAKSLREEMLGAYKEAVEKLNITRTHTSELYLKSLALAIPNSPEIKTETKNVMGIRIPKVEASESILKHFPQRGYGIVTGSALIDEAAHGFEKVVDLAVKVSEIEISMKKILAEIEKTKRRVNSLEFSVIPEMEKASRFIAFRLEEIERDNISSMKHIKKKK